MYTVQIVDDETYIRKELRHLIEWEDYGFHIVHEARTGKEALQQFEEQPVDVIITDIEMPEMTGIDYISMLRQKGHMTKVIFLTGFGEFEYAREAIKLEVKDYLLKPIEEDQLIHVLDQLTAHFKLQEEIDANLRFAEEKKLLDVLVGKAIREVMLDKFFKLPFVKVAIVEVKGFDEVGEIWLKEQVYEQRMATVKQAIWQKIGQTIRHTEGELGVSYFVCESSEKEDTCLLPASFTIEGIEVVVGESECVPKEALKEAFKQAKSQLEHVRDKLIVESTQSPKVTETNKHKQRLVQKACTYMEEHIEQEMTLNDIARYLDISRNYLCAIFKQEKGENFLNYMTRIKIERAKVLLTEDNLRVYEVAQKLQYTDVNYFSQLFRRYTGVLPRDYKRNG